MESKDRYVTAEREVSRVRFSRDGKAVLIDPTFKAIRDNRGQLRFEITIPNAHKIVFPDDLGVLLQCFGWGMAGLGQNLTDNPNIDPWYDCCEVIGKVEYCLRLL
jgi:hypothetical protein